MGGAVSALLWGSGVSYDQSIKLMRLYDRLVTKLDVDESTLPIIEETLFRVVTLLQDELAFVESKLIESLGLESAD